MNEADHRKLMEGFASVLSTHEWGRLGDFVTDDAIWEFPQSGERFRGLANIRGQFENYPGLEPGSSELQEVIGGTDYALTPNYTLVTVQGSGDRGAALVRVRYPDGSRWWAVNLYEVRDGKLARSRSFFAPELEPPDWRAPFREGA
ncbi:MAG: nuclear transport factor 2 family protein [Chloroflexi bacterium]|nr:nuclear transport factor 2 family protein [Chloroflexota bacterium]